MTMFKDLQQLMIKGNLNAIKTFIETSQHSQHAPSPVPEQQYDDEGPECEQVDSQEEKTDEDMKDPEDATKKAPDIPHE